MSLSKSIKNNPNTYIAFKLKGNPLKISQYKKAYKRIRDLDIIDSDNYRQIHKDALDLDIVLHYLFFGINDSLETQQSYISDIFNLTYYKEKYNSNKPVWDYVLEGFFKNNTINILDNNYINTLETPIHKQYFDCEAKKVESIVKNSTYIRDKKTLIPYIQRQNPINTNKIRVGVFTNDTFENLAPCPYIRIHAIFSELSKCDKYTFFMYGMDSFVMMDIDNILRSKLFDVVIVQRILPFLDLLRQKCEKYSIPIIYETDDDLLAVEKDSPSYEYVKRVENSIKDFINASDVVTVTTDKLSSKFDENKTVIIPNYYVNTVFKPRDDIKRAGKLKLGYYGTLTHSQDLFLIKDVILKLKEKYEFDFEIIGGFNESDEISDDWFKAIELPPDNMNFKKFMNWLSKTVNWDIAIVPLKDTIFNQSKSELKYIELSILSIPAVYSDMCVYNSVIENGINGFLAKSDNDWIEKIEMLINDESLRKQISQNAQKDVFENYTLNNRVNLWDAILSKYG